MLLQNQETITGKVTDSKGQPIPGVNVKVKGGTATSITDQNGNYKIIPGQKAEFLTFSLSGYKTVEEKIAGRNIINVRMKND